MEDYEVKLGIEDRLQEILAAEIKKRNNYNRFKSNRSFTTLCRKVKLGYFRRYRNAELSMTKTKSRYLREMRISSRGVTIIRVMRFEK